MTVALLLCTDIISRYFVSVKSWEDGGDCKATKLLDYPAAFNGKRKSAAWDGRLREGAIGFLIVTHDILPKLTRALDSNTPRVAHSLTHAACCYS
jgi:hypothetical protein